LKVRQHGSQTGNPRARECPNRPGHLWVIDAKGDKAEVTIPNVMQSNGVIQVINKVLLPG
jgi:Fasciclin domain